MVTEVRIRAFRATEDPETCLKFIQGHRRVLEIYGISNITTNTNNWMYNPSIFVIVVETMDGEKLFGGARVQAADGIHPLPVEDAIGKMDPKIHSEVRHYAQFGAAELSGLWNSKEVAGLGIGSLFPSRVAVALTASLGIQVMFSLCSPATVRFQKWMGGRELETVGNKGTFYYPKLDLIATVLYSDDMLNLTKALPSERERALYIRKYPNHVAREKSPFSNNYVNIHYETEIPSANPYEFKLSQETINWCY